jgi:hypothetical protein
MENRKFSKQRKKLKLTGKLFARIIARYFFPELTEFAVAVSAFCAPCLATGVPERFGGGY